MSSEQPEREIALTVPQLEAAIKKQIQDNRAFAALIVEAMIESAAIPASMTVTCFVQRFGKERS